MIYELEFIASVETLLPEDFTAPKKTDIINLNYFVSLSELYSLYDSIKDDDKPNLIGRFATLRMADGNMYHISEDSYKKLRELLKRLKP